MLCSLIGGRVIVDKMDGPSHRYIFNDGSFICISLMLQVLEEGGKYFFKRHRLVIYSGPMLHEGGAEYALETSHESSVGPVEEHVCCFPPKHRDAIGSLEENCARNGDMLIFNRDQFYLILVGNGIT